jgi:hypothetical protein
MIDLGQYDAIRSRGRIPPDRPFAGVRERAALSRWINDDCERAARFVRRCRAIRKAGRVPKVERAK